MDLFEKMNRAFGSWYEGLFGGSEDVRPKDILRLILAAMEDNRKEGFDNRTYVPNQYLLELAVHDEEEKEYLLAFLDRAELEEAIRRYCKQNNYHIRGALEFTVTELEEDKPVTRREKIQVRCRYNTKIALAPSIPTVAGANSSSPPSDPREDRTVAGIRTQHDPDEDHTMPSVATAVLVLDAPSRTTFRYVIHQKSITIGRSQKSGNDIAIETDTQMSRQHARIELGRDGRFTLYDLKTTNGTKVNGGHVDNYRLMNGDEIRIGLTKIVFQQESSEMVQTKDSRVEVHSAPAAMYGGAVAEVDQDSSGSSSSPPFRPLLSRAARLILLDNGADRDDFLLATDNFIGRGVINDIVLPDKSVATRHAHVQFSDGDYILESLKSDNATTLLNGIPLMPGHPNTLKQGDKILLGQVALRFEAGS